MTASVTTAHDLGVEVVTVRGELDLKTAPELRAALVAAIDATDNGAGAVGGVLVDLTEVSFIDSTALAAFVAARAHAMAAGATLELVCPNPDIQRLFTLTALNRVFRILDEVPVAPAAPTAAGANAARRRSVGVSSSSEPTMPVVHSVQFDATDEAPAAARRFISEKLADLPAPVRDDLLLLASEVVTNAVRYGGNELELRLSTTTACVRVEVQDPGSSVLPEAPESVDANAGNGRGLMIVSALASGWGVQPAADGNGKTVWFELSR